MTRAIYGTLSALVIGCSALSFDDEPVRTSARKGPAAGTLIMVQMLDAAKVAAIAELTLLEVKLLAPSSRELPPGLTAALASGAEPDS